MEACNAGPDNDCPFTEGVGASGIYFSFDNGVTWTQPTYTGWSGRDAAWACPATTTRRATPRRTGRIGTLPRYDEARPRLRRRPGGGVRPGARGGREVLVGQRLAAVLREPRRAPSRGPSAFKGAEAIAVSRTDNPQAAAASAADEAAWKLPVIASRQTSAQFSDKEQIWADNAASSPFFGNVYVCYADFRGNGNGFTNQPLMVLTLERRRRQLDPAARSRPATNNIHSKNGFGRSGCTVRTDSHGVVYVFTFQFGFSADDGRAGQIQMIKSFDGGKHWTTAGEHLHRPSTRATTSSRRSGAAWRTAWRARVATSRPRRRWTSPTARRRAAGRPPPDRIVMSLGRRP